MDKPYNDSAWLILTCLSEVITIKEPQFVLDFYHNEINSIPNVGIIVSHSLETVQKILVSWITCLVPFQVSTYISQLVIDVLWFTWRQLQIPDKKSLAQELNTDLYLFKVPVPLISRAVDIRYGLHLHLENVKNNDADNPPEWAQNLIKVGNIELNFSKKKIMNVHLIF